MFDIDFHSHVLPGIDDGARSLRDSCDILNALFAQGVSVVVGTPHFRTHKHDLHDFCQVRRRSYEALRSVIGEENAGRVRIGAEVAVEYGLSGSGDLSALAYEGTNYLLLELPYRQFDGWMLEEITNISYDYFLTPVIAHIDRYTEIYSEDDYASLLSLPDVIFQINNEAFLSKKTRRIVDTLISRELPFVLGSDSHNMTARRPNFDLPVSYLNNYTPHPIVQRFKNSILA